MLSAIKWLVIYLGDNQAKYLFYTTDKFNIWEMQQISRKNIVMQHP